MRRGLATLADQLEEIIAASAVAVIIASVGWGVVTRYVTAQPAAWASEIATLAFAWCIYFGAAACIKYRLLPTIDMLVDRLPAAARQAVRWLNHVLLLGFFGFMIWFGTRFAIDTWHSPSPVLRWPQTFLYGPVAVASALMAIRYLQRMAGRDWSADATRETHAG